jgi:hypothetical protein
MNTENSFFKLDVFFHNTGKRHRLFESSDEALSNSDYKREIRSKPQKYFSRITQIRKKADGFTEEVNVKYFV